MSAINEQRDVANEISDAISNPLNAGLDLDEVREARWRPTDSPWVTRGLIWSFVGRAQVRAGGARAGTARRATRRRRTRASAHSGGPKPHRGAESSCSCAGGRRRGTTQGIASFVCDIVMAFSMTHPSYLALHDPCNLINIVISSLYCPSLVSYRV
jgi:hypothetical protein